MGIKAEMIQIHMIILINTLPNSNKNIDSTLILKVMRIQGINKALENRIVMSMLEIQRMAIIQWVGSQIIQAKNLNTNYKMMMLTDKHCSWAVRNENGAQRYPNLEKMPGAF